MALSIPALNQLRCFEAAARHENFTLAADELCLTPSAVSHQIRTLEAALNVALFVRLGRKTYLSELGRQFLADIQPAFAMIEAGTRRLQSSTPREVLTLAAAPSFAEAWLMPNLSRFIVAHPEMEVRLITSDPGGADDDRNIDCEIRYGHGKWVGLSVEKIADDVICPLASPEIAASMRSPDDEEVLRRHTLIQTESRQFGWDQWFRAQRRTPPGDPMRLRVDRSPLAIKAAVDSLGIALESLTLSFREIREGALVPLTGLADSMPLAEETYYLVHSHSRASSARVAAFANWLKSDFENSSIAPLARPIRPAEAPPSPGFAPDQASR